MSKAGVVNIKGKEYQTVALRVHNFREEYPDWTIETELVSRDDEFVVMRCRILNENGRLIGGGYAEERRNASTINQTSALENAETSAIGRALASIGFGGTEYASANEVQNAIHQQKITPAAGASDGLTPEEIQNASQLSVDIRAHEEDAAQCLRLWEIGTSEWPSDQKVFCWSLIPSNIRSAIKKLQKEKQNGA